jgi:hypothetical protein
MDKQEAFRRIWASEGNAARAARLLSEALVVRLVGWDGLRLNRSRVQDLRRVLDRAGVDPAEVAFFAETDPSWTGRAALTRAEIEVLRVTEEREFGMLAVNMRGHLYKKTEWREFRNNPTTRESPNDETD